MEVGKTNIDYKGEQDVKVNFTYNIVVKINYEKGCEKMQYCHHRNFYPNAFQFLRESLRLPVSFLWELNTVS